MKQYLSGFFMAWGNFCALPCPCKRWDTNATPLMLGFLPSVGVIIGAIWAALYFAAVYFGLPYLVVAFLVTFLPFALCGFLHMDGFMDCSDAILSRRPLEDRQRILKDSHTGAFAVISIVFYILAYFAFTSTAITIGIDFANMILLVCEPLRFRTARADRETDADQPVREDESCERGCACTGGRRRLCGKSRRNQSGSCSRSCRAACILRQCES